MICNSYYMICNTYYMICNTYLTVLVDSSARSARREWEKIAKNIAS